MAEVKDDTGPGTLREAILDATVAVFNARGARFTLDELARSMRISKKTIYTVFTGKESLLNEMVEEGFRRVKVEEERVYNDITLSHAERFKRIVIVMPDSLRHLDFGQFPSIRTLYPAVYDRIVTQLETGWERTLALLKSAMDEGSLRRVSIPLIKLLIESGIEALLAGKQEATPTYRKEEDSLVRQPSGPAGCHSPSLDYLDALDGMMDIFMNGLLIREGKQCAH